VNEVTRRLTELTQLVETLEETAPGRGDQEDEGDDGGSPQVPMLYPLEFATAWGGGGCDTTGGSPQTAPPHDGPT